VLSPDPRLLRLGQLLAKPRGVVPKENNLRLKTKSKHKKYSRSLLQQENITISKSTLATYIIHSFTIIAYEKDTQNQRDTCMKDNQNGYLYLQVNNINK
jgi:hypothetical protein